MDLAPDYVISQTPELNGEDSRVSATGALELRLLLDRVNSSIEKLENEPVILISNDHGQSGGGCSSLPKTSKSSYSALTPAFHTGACRSFSQTKVIEEYKSIEDI